MDLTAIPVHAPRRLIVVGNGMAATRLLEEVSRLAPGRFAITVFGAEPGGCYNRILLSPVLAGEKQATDIVTHDPGWYAARGITLHASEAVIEIDRAARQVRGSKGHVCGYDHLILATGSDPVRLPLPGADFAGVTGFRDLADVAAMTRTARTGGAAVVVGGGLLGLEAAWGLHRRGMAVTVLHLLPGLMERQLDAEAARLLARDLNARGIAVRTGAATRALLGEGGAVSGVALEDGTVLAARLVVMAVGIRPRVALARAAELEIGRGIHVDDGLATSDPAILAIGECVEHRGQVFGLVAPAYDMAGVAAARLAGDARAWFRPEPIGIRLKVTGIDMFSAGDFLGGPGTECLAFRDRARGVYRRLMVRENRLVGALLYGDAADGPYYQQLMTEAAPLGAAREALIFGPPPAAPAASRTADLMTV